MPKNHSWINPDTDLLVHTSACCNNNSSLAPAQSTTEFICVTLLIQLILNGEWIFDNSVMPQLLMETFLSVKFLWMTGWMTTASVDSLFRLLRGMLSDYDNPYRRSPDLELWNVSPTMRMVLASIWISTCPVVATTF